MRQIRNTAAFIFTMLFIWLFASFVDVNIHNVDGDGYASWNVFVVAVEKPEAAEMPEKPDAAELSEKPDAVEMPGKSDAAELSGKSDVQEDILLLAKLIEAENGSARHDETLILTGVCVLKRVQSKLYPNTIRGVIYQKGKKGRAYATAPELNDVTPSARAMEISEELLVYGVDEYPDGLVFQAMFPQGRKIYKELDGEYFCLE